LLVVAATMLRLSRKQREALSQTLRELGNLLAGALVLTQFVGQQAPSWRLVVLGATGWIVLVSVALLFLGRRP
jgi:hypothetical protein